MTPPAGAAAGRPAQRTRFDGAAGPAVAPRLDTVLSGAREPGVYRWLSRAHPEPVRRELSAADWTSHLLDGRGLTGATEVLDRHAEQLSFPGWFRHTWDGFADCLADLSWLPGRGHLLLWERYGVLARTDPTAWAVTYRSLVAATRSRRVAGLPPLYVLLRGPGPVTDPEGAPIPVL
ncbi:Barstar (barnase inhibitor) [Micromonospora pattaloongensis]|uniref:Barstar (Barnase inhibitor) n=1 Tax=Micromonospora pattaloongensis TaxID=405436 RepID=A0A1H3Q072_9ACTN|nr:barstar family protein [Micromonospora pattaloongensis]SDZ06934.1 Barstar (barnase inhibitor) [Micromonospora pattaloongensis]